jgi:ribonuclease HI
MLKAVYFPNTDILQANIGSNPSQIWRALCEGRDVLSMGLIRRIGDGRTTNVWNENWVPRNFNLRPVCAKTREPPQRVSEFMCATTRTWKEEVLNQHLIPMDVEAVKTIPISHTMQPDFWAWHYEKNGIFTVRSAYKMIVEIKQRRLDWLEGRTATSNSEEKEKQWKNLWKVKVPAKLKIFAWRLARSSLPTGQERVRRHMSTTSVCPICSAADDDWRHSLINCNMARAVWALMDDEIVDPVIMDETTDPKLWLMTLCNTLNQRVFVQILVTLWSIWWARRKAIHEDEFQSPLSTHVFIKKYLSELDWVQGAQQNVPPVAGRTEPVKWIRPDHGVMKLNVDGAVAKTMERGAVGVVCRSDQGVYLGASAVVFEGITDPAMLEALACREALVLAEDLQLQKVKVASDCLSVVHDINSGGCHSQYSMIVRDIALFRAKFQEASYGHERREANGEAHRLARSATSLGLGRHVWFMDPPDHLCIPMNII